MELNYDSTKLSNGASLGLERDRTFEIMHKVDDIVNHAPMPKEPVMQIAMKIAKECNSLEEYTFALLFATRLMYTSNKIELIDPREIDN